MSWVTCLGSLVLSDLFWGKCSGKAGGKVESKAAGKVDDGEVCKSCAKVNAKVEAKVVTERLANPTYARAGATSYALRGWGQR